MKEFLSQQAMITHALANNTVVKLKNALIKNKNDNLRLNQSDAILDKGNHYM